MTPSAGSLDATFGLAGDGRVTTDFEAKSDIGNALALQTDGKIVVAGTTRSGGSGENFAVARYFADGTPDSSFSFDGHVATDIAGSDDEGRGVAIQADGKIIMAGTAVVNGSNAFALARYNPDGLLDDTFGDHGKVTTDFTAGFDAAFALTLQADGKILVTGQSGSRFILARYKSDGQLDDDFGDHGKFTTDFTAGSDGAVALALQADGKIVAAGVANIGSSSDFALARYLEIGTLDPTFGDQGIVTTDFGGEDQGRSVAIQADGMIVVAGYSRVGGIYHFALARYSPDGELDSNFDADGMVNTDFGVEALSLAIQPSGKIVAAGLALASGGTLDFALARYNTDGSPDESFGTGGKVTTDFGVGGSISVNDIASGMVIQPDGKILVAGTASPNSGLDFALARYQGVGPRIAVTLGGANVSDSTVAFGNTPVGTPVTKTFTVRNIGDLGLSVTSITLPAGYQLTTAFPFKLAAGAQTSLSVRLTAATAGVFSGKILLGNNDSIDNPFNFVVTGTALAPTHEIQVLNGTTDIPDGTGVVNLGTATLQTRSDPHIFTVRNIGNTNLTLGPSISASSFIIASGFGSTTLTPGASTTFALALNTSNVGTFTGKVVFATNDSDENPFSFVVKGAVSTTSASPMIRGESLTRHVVEGGVATLRGHLVDPDAQDELFLRVDWNDGTEPETYTVGRAPFALQHRYLDDGPSDTPADDYQVHLTWFDSGGGSNSKTLPVTVHNVAPQVSAELPVLLRAGATLTRVGSFADPGLDSWYATVDYDDGRGPQWLALGPDNRFTLSQRYTQPGVHHILVRVVDDDGGISAAIVPVTVMPAKAIARVGRSDADRLVGSASDDILIAGLTAFDPRDRVLPRIKGEWTSGRDDAARVAHSQRSSAGPRNNGDYFLTVHGPAATAFGDGSEFILTGRADVDWLFANLDADIKDRISALSVEKGSGQRPES